MAGTVMATAALAVSMGNAIVAQDQVSLRAAPRDSALQQTVLWQGEALEVRGERLDYLQVWDHKRERGGFVKASEVRRIGTTEADAAATLAVLRFVRDTPGSEALGIGLAAAYVEAASPATLSGVQGAQALDALGTLADRLARRASATPAAAPSAPAKGAGAQVSAHLDVATGHGVRFASHETEGSMQVCYEGDAFRRLLALPAADAEQKARAAVALTRPECVNPAASATERQQLLSWQLQVLDRVDGEGLAPHWHHRVRLRRAGLLAAHAFQAARQSPQAPQVQQAATRALQEWAAVQKAELPDEDLPTYNDTAMRVSAVRWAVAAAGLPKAASGKARVQLQPQDTGETCVLVLPPEGAKGQEPLLRRCTYGVVWPASLAYGPGGQSMALAVQPTDGWRELWLLRQTASGWVADVLPPTSAGPELGVAEFAGWVPGTGQVLVGRESRTQGRYRRSFEVVKLDGLVTERVTYDVAALPLFQRWQDARWKQQSLMVR